MDDNWIWVDGYKFTNENMQGYGNFQYELNKLYHQDGDIEDCKNGFHFSLEPEHLFSYMQGDYLSKRFFKCKGLVRESDKESYGKIYEVLSNSYFPSPFTSIKDKIAAKEILLTEEITDSDLVIRLLIQKNSHFRFLQEMETRPHSSDEYIEQTWKIVNELTKYGYSKAYITLMLSDGVFPSYPLYVKMKAYGEEGLSPDMRAYLLSRNLQK